MLQVIRFKGKNNRKQFIAWSEVLRQQQIFHTVKLLDNQSIICYTNNIRGLELLEKEDSNG